MEIQEKRTAAQQDGEKKIVHTFAICAYGDSPYLEECMASLMRQGCGSEVICCTSTPSSYIDGVAKSYGIPVYVREGKSNIREDWLFAYEKARGDLVTISHQDDRYERDYGKILLSMYRKYQDMTVFCSDYATIRMEEEGGRLQPKLQIVNAVWLVKKLLRLPLRARFLADRKMVKRASLLFGNSICCPSCTYNKRLIGSEIFESSFEFALDWDNLYELAGKKGRFVCSERQLIFYRVHPEATTKQCIEDNRRKSDETAMFQKMWPKPAVRMLMYFYRKAYGAYEK